MQISSNHSLAIIPGYAPERPLRHANREQPAHSQAQANIEARRASPVIVLQRQPIRAQPLFHQNLTHRGEQAARTYRDVEFGGEAELMSRLDETA